MKFANSILTLGLGVLPATLAFQQAGPAKDATAPAKADAHEASSPDAAKLVKQLGDSNYKTRKEAFRALEKIGAAARPALEKALKSDDAEVRWSAALLLDRLDEDGDKSDARSSGLKPRAGSDEDADDGSDATDPSLPPARSSRAFDDLSQQMRDMTRRMRELQHRFSNGQGDLGFDHDPFDFDFFRSFGQDDRGGARLELGPGSSYSMTTTDNGRTKSVKIEVDPKGHVTATTDEDGKTTKIEADSIEAFRKDHPDLLEGFGGVHVFSMPRAQFRAPVAPDPTQPPRALRPHDQDSFGPRGRIQVEPAPAGKPRLGVQIAPVSPDVAEYLELEPGSGVEVVKVLDNTPAAKLGLKRHDVITEVNGRKIASVDDVLKALEGKNPEEAQITVIRRAEPRKL